MNGPRGFGHPYLTRHNEQRYLLQLGFVDRLLGRLIRQLKRTGIYDDTLILVTADHGFAWQVGVPTRRSVSNGNVEELTPVPFFVKAPGQRRGRVNDAYVETLDVTPTIADVLGMRLGYRTDGSSAFSRGGAPAARRGRDHPRLQRDRPHLRPALGGAAPRGGQATAAGARIDGLGEPVHGHRAAPVPARPGDDSRRGRPRPDR